MTAARAWVRIDWEPDGAPYLAISRPDMEVERIPLSTSDVARLLADGAYLWSMVEPRRQGRNHCEDTLDMVDMGR